MASIETNSSRNSKGQPNRVNLRVDFTPMVDMNMLLITFFMFCTTLATPQVMDIVMPTRENNVSGTEYAESKTTTLILGENNRIFYYEGLPKYEDPSTLKETNAEGLRALILNRNGQMVEDVKALKMKRKNKEINEEEFKKQLAELRKTKGDQLVVIKPMEGCSYESLVRTLDEIAICSIGKYAIVDVEPGDRNLLQKYSQINNLAYFNTEK